MRSDPQLPPVFDHALARRVGMSRHQITHRVRTGVWYRLRRGVFCSTATWEAATPERRAALLGMATVLLHTSAAPYALSHATAAALHGLPVPPAGPTWVTVAAGYGATTHMDHALRQEVASLPPEHLQRIDGWPVTSLARTVADCLRHLPAEASVAVADAAYQRRGLTLDPLRRVVDWQAAWPLAGRARTALDIVDGRRESVLESRSAVVMHRFRVPAPLCQVDVSDASGRFIGRVDFAWPEAGVVGEADGRAKYGLDPLQAFEAEKDRQAALEALGLVVVRWGWRHLAGDPPVMVTRLRTALARGARRPFTGSLAHVRLPCGR